MKAFSPLHRRCLYFIFKSKVLIPSLFFLFFLSCNQNEDSGAITFTFNISGFSFGSEEFESLKSRDQDIFNGFVHKYPPAILILTSSDGTEYNLNTGNISVNNFEITLPTGEYSLSGNSLSGGKMSEAEMSFNIPLQSFLIENSTTEIDITVIPTSILVVLADELSLVNKAYFGNETNSFFNDGIFRYSYLNNKSANAAIIEKENNTRLELILGKQDNAHYYKIIVTEKDSSELIIPNSDKVYFDNYMEYRGQPQNGSIIDARNGVWSFENGWIATPNISKDIYWVGGTFFLTINDQIYSPTDAWEEIWHHNGGWTLKHDNVNWVFDKVSVMHVGDAFNITTGTAFFTIKNSYVADIRDDAVQNDMMYSGDVLNNFFDGVYVGFSARHSTPRDGHLETWRIIQNLIWIKPMYSVFKGDSPGNGQIIKWQTDAPELCPHLVFKNNIVRVGKLPFQTDHSYESFYFPPDVDFENNVLIWDGELPVPHSLTKWFDQNHNSRIGTLEDWDIAVQNWYNEHPYFTIN